MYVLSFLERKRKKKLAHIVIDTLVLPTALGKERILLFINVNSYIPYELQMDADTNDNDDEVVLYEYPVST